MKIKQFLLVFKNVVPIGGGILSGGLKVNNQNEIENKKELLSTHLLSTQLIFN